MAVDNDYNLLVHNLNELAKTISELREDGVRGEPPGWPYGFPSSQGPVPPGVAAVGFGAGTTAAPPRALHPPAVQQAKPCARSFRSAA